MPTKGASQIIADGFDYPTGKPNAQGYYDAQNFGQWNAKFKGYHTGEDWNGNNGNDSDLNDPVYSIANGEIMTSEFKKVWGNVVVIQHILPNNIKIYSMYGHLNNIHIRKGDLVKRGQQIGTIGKGENNRYSAHLHFEIRTDTNPDKLKPGIGYSKTPKPNGWVDPSEFIDSHRQLISPPAPLSISSSDVDSSSVTISWEKNKSPYFSSYKLYRSQTPNIVPTIPPIAIITDENQTSFTDNSLELNNTYYYKLIVFNIAEQSAESNEIEIKTFKNKNNLGEIVYTSKVNGVNQIFVINVESKASKQLTFFKFNTQNPKWSPSGEKIAFSTIEESPSGERQIFLMDKNGLNIKKVTNAKFSAEQPDWFQDEQKIAYIGFDEVITKNEQNKEIKTNVKGIFFINIEEENAEPQLITPDNLTPHSFSIAPNNKNIIFRADYKNSNKKGGLFAINTDGSNLTQLTEENDNSPDISPDNKYITFTSTRETKHNWFWDIYIAELELIKFPAQITNAKYGSTYENPSWNSNSKGIVFSKRQNQNSDFEIIIYNIEEQIITQLTDNKVDDKEPDWFIKY